MYSDSDPKIAEIQETFVEMNIDEPTEGRKANGTLLANETLSEIIIYIILSGVEHISVFSDTNESLRR